MEKGKRVDVIALCGADGELRPLRLRVENEDKELTRMNILQVVSRKEVRYVGAEADYFVCIAEAWGRERLIELKFSLRTHSWQLAAGAGR